VKPYVKKYIYKYTHTEILSFYSSKEMSDSFLNTYTMRVRLFHLTLHHTQSGNP